LTKKGRKSVETIGSYLKLRGVCPDAMLSSCALRAQETADLLAKKLEFEAPVSYLRELYFTDTQTLKEMVSMQEGTIDTLFVIGHNPQITDMANLLIGEHISKIPTMGVAAINFEIEEWSEIKQIKGELDFFIYPKQFQHYIPNQIRSILSSQKL